MLNPLRPAGIAGLLLGFFGLFLAASTVARAADDAGDEGDDAADNGAPTAVVGGASAAWHQPQYQIIERMWGKDSKNRFWKEARGGKEFKKFYSTYFNSGDRETYGKGNGADADADYDPVAEKAAAVIYRPAGYKPADAAEWGVYLHLVDCTDDYDSRYWQEYPFAGRNPSNNIKPILDERKLIFVSPKLARKRSDVYQLCLALDALKAAFEATPGLSESKRIYVGGTGDGARVAGILAFNFPKIFRGYFALTDVALKNTCEIYRNRSNNSTSIYAARRVMDIPYLDKNDWNALRKTIRISGFTGHSYLGHQHYHMVRGLHDYTKDGFKVLLLDPSDEYRPRPATFGDGLDWLDGKAPTSVVPNRAAAYGLTWPK